MFGYKLGPNAELGQWGLYWLNLVLPLHWFSRNGSGIWFEAYGCSIFFFLGKADMIDDLVGLGR